MAFASASACVGEKTPPWRKDSSGLSASSSMRRLPSMLMRLISGYSSTRMISRFPLGTKSTERKKPVWATRSYAALSSEADIARLRMILAKPTIVSSSISALPSTATLLKRNVWACALCAQAPVIITKTRKTVAADRVDIAARSKARAKMLT